MSEDKRDVKFGIIVVALVAVALLLIFFSSVKSFLKPTKIIKVGFSSAGGLGPDLPVKYKGTDVGVVKAVHLINEDDTNASAGDYRVVFDCKIDAALDVKHNTRAIVKSIGLMGEKTIDLVPSYKDAPVLRRGEVLRGEEPFDFDTIVKDGQKIMASVNTIYTAFSDLKNDEAFTGGLKNTLSDLRGLLDDVNDIRQENKKDLDNIKLAFAEISESLYSDFGSFTGKFSDIRSVMTEMKKENADDLAKIKENMDEASIHFAGYNKLVEEKGIFIHLKVPPEVKEALKSDARKKREARERKLSR